LQYIVYGQSSGPTSEIGQAANVPEVLLLVGPPACGKSTLARSLQHTHVRVNQDLLKTRKVCLKVATDHFVALKKGDISAEQPQGIVVDATNANRGVRKEWIDFAKENSVVGLTILRTYSMINENRLPLLWR
jgi:predicted kinase